MAPSRPRLLVAVFVAMASSVLLTATPAGAHAEPRTSDPSPGDEVSAGLDEVEITFIDLDPDGAIDIRVEDASGADLTSGSPELRNDGATVIVATEPLEPGPHVVRWDVLSSDGDGRADGTIDFVVTEGSSGGGVGVWLLWAVVLVIPAAIFLRPKRPGRAAGDDGAVV